MHIVHCNQSCDKCIGRVESHVRLRHVNSHVTTPFQYFSHVGDCSVQCAIGTENHEMTDSILLIGEHTYLTNTW